MIHIVECFIGMNLLKRVVVISYMYHSDSPVGK